MAITTNNIGFDSAQLEADNCAELTASISANREAFRVSTDADGKGWFFDEPACREAAEFFLKLADELKRRAA